MDPRNMKSNEDLYEYLCWLAEKVRKHGQEELADRIAAASHFASGSPSEFLHEADCALKETIARKWHEQYSRYPGRAFR